jgi:hypothetical protein
VRKFGIDEKADGEELVNAVFAPKSPHRSNLSPGEKAAYRNLFAGMFGLLRNRFAHNDAQPDLSELDTALANVNTCLRIVGDFQPCKSVAYRQCHAMLCPFDLRHQHTNQHDCCIETQTLQHSDDDVVRCNVDRCRVCLV